MSNKDWRNTEENVHVLCGFLRKKTNPDARPRCIRRIEKSSDDLQILKRELQVIGGNWRIHRTVNKRSTAKAFKILQHYMLDHPDCARFLDSEWKTTLLQPESKAEKKFMLDIDTNDLTVISEAESIVGDILESVKTPSGGMHWIVQPFDRRNIEHLKDITVLTDGYIFVDQVLDDRGE
ncbi:MAG: hypothetical protein QG556_369 [Pseudomonadota bacterium]|nr:hypothetical protein [Pseudomonadota bacterium]